MTPAPATSIGLESMPLADIAAHLATLTEERDTLRRHLAALTEERDALRRHLAALQQSRRDLRDRLRALIVTV